MEVYILVVEITYFGCFGVFESAESIYVFENVI